MLFFDHKVDIEEFIRNINDLSSCKEMPDTGVREFLKEAVFKN